MLPGLDEHELPDPADFPTAAEPNAKLVVAEIDGEERVVLVATRAINSLPLRLRGSVGVPMAAPIAILDGAAV